MVTLLPALASVSLYWSGRLLGAYGATRCFVPMAIEVLALTLMNKLLPRTTVNWSASVLGAMITAVLIESLKAAFVGFAKNMLLSSYTGVYGSLGRIRLMGRGVYGS